MGLANVMMKMIGYSIWEILEMMNRKTPIRMWIDQQLNK